MYVSAMGLCEIESHGKGDVVALYAAEGIVLRTRNLGEADRIVTLYTRDHGKVECVARGSRRARSRLIGGTQLFTHGTYMLYSGRSLDSLNQAEIVESFAALREDLVAMAFASYFAELLDICVEPGEPSEDLYQLCLGAFKALQDGVQSDLVSRWFEFNVMTILGYAPQLEACVGCGEVGESETRFSSREGGLLCTRCARRDSAAVRVRRSTVEWLRRLLTTPSDRLGIVRISSEDMSLLESAGRAYIDFRVPRPIKSLGFLASIKDLA